jgi:protein polybromo-1
MAMSIIQKKLKKNEYANITDLSTDLYLMIDNAKKANPPTSRIYKDAVKMHKILGQKLIDDGLDDDDTEDTEDSATLCTPSSGAEKKKKGRPRIHPVSSSTSPAPSTPIASSSTGKFIKFPSNPIMKKKLLSLHKFLIDYTIEGRSLIEPFIEKPSKKLYPDYYTIIQHPIDMTTIERNIENDRYGTVDDIVGDYRLMFNNCRKYNEENSMIYDDATRLEKVLNQKLKDLSGVQDRRLKM